VVQQIGDVERDVVLLGSLVRNDWDLHEVAAALERSFT
jgi:hypothetical protein